MYELFEHTADLGLRVTAPDLEALFRDAAEGLCAMIVEPSADDRGGERREFAIAGERRDWLLCDWLAELLYVFESERVVLGDFVVALDEQGLRASASVRPLDPRRHELLHEVKAITYHGLRVERVGEGWLAEVIVDI